MAVAISASAATAEPLPEPAASAIRDVAVRDARSSAVPHRSEAVALVRIEYPTASAIALGSEYDKAYTEQAKRQPIDWAEKLKSYRNWVGIALVVVFLLGAALRNVLTGWVSAGFKAIGDWTYARFAGSRMLRQLALRRYRAALVTSLRWLKVTFRPNQPLDMREVYVPLRVAGSTGAATFDACDMIAQHRRLMVKGAPGSGKSVLLRHIAHSFAEGRLDRLPGDPVPVLLELHRLKGEGLNVEKLVAELAAAFARYDFPKAENFLRQALEQGSVILLFDGLDEVASQDRAAVIRVIQDTLATYRNCRAVVTCRSAVYHNELHEAVDQTLEIAEFSDQQIRRFLRSWMRVAPPGKTVEELVQTLRDRPLIMSLARNPLLLTILAYLYTDTPLVLPHSRAEFYERATDVLLGLRDEERGIQNKYRSNDKRRVLQHLAVTFQEYAAADAQGDRRSLDCDLVRERVRKLLPSLNLQSADAEPLLDEIVERSGLLLSIDHGQRYQFAHLTIQEFFAAGALKDNESEMLRRLEADPDGWRETARLWCGLAGNSTSFLSAVRDLDLLTAVECLADAAEVDEAIADEILQAAELKQNAVDETVAYAGPLGNVAASPRPRGRRIFEFLVASIGPGPDCLQRDMAAFALALSNLPAAAEALARAYLATKNGRLLDALIRMGDVAVPWCAQIAKDGHLELLDTLREIGTPDAARALADLLWSDEPSAISVRAAVNLAVLLPQSAIEEELDSYPLTVEQRRAVTLEWIWSPFVASSDSSLPLIAGRIGHLVGNASLEDFDSRLRALDPRIIVPLCAIQMHDELKLAERWDNEGDVLVAAVGTNRDQERQVYMRHMLGVMPERSPRHALLSSLAPSLEFELLRRLKEYRKPSVEDWRRLFDRIEYTMRTGWHYRSVLVLALLLTFGALGELPLSVSAHRHDWRVAASLVSCAWSLPLSWFLFWKGGQNGFDAEVFLEAGLKGPVAFLTQTARLMRQRRVGTVGQSPEPEELRSRRSQGRQLQ